MTQDQYGQARGPGNVIHGDPVPEEETDERRTDDTKPMTRFQKVASALRGDRTDRDEADTHEPGTHRPSTGSEDATGSDVMAPGGDTSAMSPSNPPYVTERDEAAMTDPPIYQETGEGRTPAAGDIGPAASRAGEPSAMNTAGPDAARRDYWDEPVAARQNEGVAAMDPGVPVDETHPDVPVSETRPDADHPATEPDMFGTAHGAGPAGAVREVPAAEGQPGAATIADVPAAASVETATGAEETAVPEAAAGRHAAAASPAAPAAPASPGDRDLRPGEAAGSLGDFSDLTYGNLIPDAARYTEQWQQIQFKFVDDPHASVTEAADIVAQVTAKLETAIQERQRAIEERQRMITEQQRSLRDRWGEGSNADTENLRATLRMYKTFLDQLIGQRAS
jgi:hypothetical protein